MTALSIRRMHDTMSLKEQVMEAYFKSLNPTNLVIHYWHVERKLKNGKWKFVARFYCTKAEIAATFVKFYRDGNHRLVHMLTYPTRK